MKEIKNVTIVGLGALGMLYGSILMKALEPEQLAFVMDEERLSRHASDVYKVNGEETAFRKISPKEAKPCDLLLVAVKSTGLAAALEVMESSVGDDTVIISVMNGITSEEIIAERFGMHRIVHAVAQGMDAMHFGNEVQYTKAGLLRLGVTDPSRQELLDRVTAFFDRTGLGYLVEEDIMYRMWSKFMVNVGINQTCMVYDACYEKAMAEGSESNMTFISAMREVVLTANAEGIPLSEKEVMEYIALLKTFAPDATPSMGQDRINKKPSEVEFFAGTVIRLAKKHGIPVPANEFLYRRVKEIEKGY